MPFTARESFLTGEGYRKSLRRRHTAISRNLNLTNPVHVTGDILVCKAVNHKTSQQIEKFNGNFVAPLPKKGFLVRAESLEVAQIE
jgi:hypothetical protein